jgi:hypothetical protein
MLMQKSLYMLLEISQDNDMPTARARSKKYRVRQGIFALCRLKLILCVISLKTRVFVSNSLNY